jgi:hypothetical protein
MRRNVLAGFAACALTAIGPGSLFGAVPAGPALRSAERHDLEQTPDASAWLWNGKLGPTWIDPWPYGPCGAGVGDVH